MLVSAIRWAWISWQPFVRARSLHLRPQAVGEVNALALREHMIHANRTVGVHAGPQCSWRGERLAISLLGGCRIADKRAYCVPIKRSNSKTSVATSTHLPYLRKIVKIRRLFGGTGLPRPKPRRFCNCLKGLSACQVRIELPRAETREPRRFPL